MDPSYLNVIAVPMSRRVALLAAVRDRPCRVSSSDLRIYVEAVGLATFRTAP